MKVGLSNCIFGRRVPVERDFVDLHNAGIRYIEVCVQEGYLSPDDTALIAKVGSWARNNGINVHSVHGPSGEPGIRYWLADPDNTRRQEAIEARRMALEAARELGAKYMVLEYECYGPRWFCWPKNIAMEKKYQTPEKLFRDSVNALLDDAIHFGVKLAIENVYGCPAVEQMEIMKVWDPNMVGVCFDSSHAVYGGHFFDEFALLAPRIIGTHLSDNDVLYGAAYMDRHWRPFAGTIDWTRLVGELVRRSRCECLMLEVLDRENSRISEELVAAYRKIECMARTLAIEPKNQQAK